MNTRTSCSSAPGVIQPEEVIGRYRPAAWRRGKLPSKPRSGRCEEETGYLCQDYERIYTYYPMTGIANQQFHIFACRAVEKVGEYDPGEIDEIHWFTRDEIRTLIRAQTIVDGPTLIALLLHFQS